MDGAQLQHEPIKLQLFVCSTQQGNYSTRNQSIKLRMFVFETEENGHMVYLDGLPTLTQAQPHPHIVFAVRNIVVVSGDASFSAVSSSEAPAKLRESSVTRSVLLHTCTHTRMHNETPVSFSTPYAFAYFLTRVYGLDARKRNDYAFA